MNTNFKTISLLFLVLISFVSCDNSDGDDIVLSPPTAAAFKGITEKGIKKNTQNFTLTAGTGMVTLTSAKGVKLNINGNCLTKNGNPVTGTVDIEYIELFDKGNMLITNKPTMGVTADGKKNLLISGGEFFIKATQGGVELQNSCTMSLIIPTALTDGLDNTMTLWNGTIDDKGELAWRENKPNADGTGGGKGGVQGEGTNYYVTFGNFGWTNVDRFYSDPRPKTTILADAPDGYDNNNSAVYLSYDGEGTNALAKLDTYTAAGLFSEHYGQIPIGLKCHVIFVTEDNGQWRYAIKAVTVAANDVYTFTLAETTVGTEAQLVAAINAIQ
jgi:FlaG/FlaF family flagellin (archaellin)